MGMTASQARFLCLTARKSNIEFEGQQINQQRTTLSNQSSSYYSELCNMVVPTPPSVDDYTKISYTFDDGAMTNTITTMIARPGVNEYTISYVQQWQDDYSIVAASSSMVAKNNDSYSINTSILRKLASIDNYDISNDPYLTELNEQGDNQINSLMLQEDYYIKILKKEYPNMTGDWFVRYIKDATNGSYKPYFYNSQDLENPDNYNDDLGQINCFSIGSSTKTQEVLNKLGTVEKDSSGRYVSITIYPEDEVDVTKGITYMLVTNTATDEDAYNEALNQYHYNQAKYDQKIQEINSKLEIVQQQDKSLELNLKHLDTEENAINAELEAVKKVISGNIEKSFKTFNA